MTVTAKTQKSSSWTTTRTDRIGRLYAPRPSAQDLLNDLLDEQEAQEDAALAEAIQASEERTRWLARRHLFFAEVLSWSLSDVRIVDGIGIDDETVKGWVEYYDEQPRPVWGGVNPWA